MYFRLDLLRASTLLVTSAIKAEWSFYGTGCTKICHRSGPASQAIVNFTLAPFFVNVAPFGPFVGSNLKLGIVKSLNLPRCLDAGLRRVGTTTFSTIVTWRSEPSLDALIVSYEILKLSSSYEIIHMPSIVVDLSSH